jgi:hypothetical protein
MFDTVKFSFNDAQLCINVYKVLIYYPCTLYCVIILDTDIVYKCSYPVTPLKKILFS